MADAFNSMCKRYERLSKKDERKKLEKRKNKRCFLWIRHKIVYINGFGYRCKHCGKPISQLNGELSTNKKRGMQ